MTWSIKEQIITDRHSGLTLNFARGVSGALQLTLSFKTQGTILTFAPEGDVISMQPVTGGAGAVQTSKVRGPFDTPDPEGHEGDGGPPLTGRSEPDNV
jgi:hypothetical protein